MSALLYAWSNDKGGVGIVLRCYPDDVEKFLGAHAFQFEPLIRDKCCVAHIDLILSGYFVSGNFGYLCLAMRKKFGDWLLDIAKYMATAILLTSIFSDMQNIWTYVIVAITVVATLLLGLWLTRDKTSEE